MLRIIEKLSMLTTRVLIKSPKSSRFFSTEMPNQRLTIQNLKDELAKSLGFDSAAKFSALPPQKNPNTSKYLAKHQSDLTPRSMRDSLLTAYIPLSVDLDLQDKYITFLDTVRLGRLLEDMDAFAVMVAMKHIHLPALPAGAPLPLAFVTALADRIEFTGFAPKPHRDIKISGHVSWVGRSSMEVLVWLEQEQNGAWHRITRALFLIAARDAAHTKAAVVNPLQPADEYEQLIYKGGEQRKAKRLASVRMHVSQVLPDQDEQKVIHDLYRRTRTETDQLSLRTTELPTGVVWMEKCKLATTIFSQPEYRNFNNTVFGGFIMRQAHELSWVLGYEFSKYRPKLKSISDINFTKPIAVNSLIHLYAYVVYTHMQYVQIMVYVYTFDPNTGKTDTTNTVHFTYEIPELSKEVFPRTYQEAMMYIDGRRHFFEIMTPPDNLDDVENSLPLSKL